MIRTLLIIAGAGLVLAAACLGGAFALGGRDMAKHDWTWTLSDSDGDKVRFERDRPDRSGPAVSRKLAWTGGGSLVIDAPVDVVFVQDDTASVTVTGPKDAIEKVSLTGDRLSWAGTDDAVVNFGHNGVRGWNMSEHVTVEVRGPNVRRFRLNSSGDLEIQDYDQPTLDITIDGSGEVTADGRTTDLTLSMDGSGEADLERLQTTNARVTVSGSGDASLAPTGEADISVSGSGDVALGRNPAKLATKVTGSGAVNT